METISLLVSESSNCQCVLHYQIFILSLTCTTVHSLTVDDFYNDTNADIVETRTDDSFSTDRDLPISISNILDFGAASKYAVSKNGIS